MSFIKNIDKGINIAFIALLLLYSVLLVIDIFSVFTLANFNSPAKNTSTINLEKEGIHILEKLGLLFFFIVGMYISGIKLNN